MKLKEITSILDAEVICGDDNLDREITMAYGSDMMSAILAFTQAGALLLTGLTNSQVIRTAEMAEISAVCFVRNKKPEKDTVDMAIKKNILLFATPLSMFESCGRLYKRGIHGFNEIT